MPSGARLLVGRRLEWIFRGCMADTSLGMYVDVDVYVDVEQKYVVYISKALVYKFILQTISI